MLCVLSSVHTVRGDAGMSEVNIEVPLLDEIKVRNQPLPLYYVHWRSLIQNAYEVRRVVSRPINDGGLDFLMTQRENTERGVETITGIALTKSLLEKHNGAEAWFKRLSGLINSQTKGAKPIEHLRLARTTQGFLCYYAPFYSDQMEIVIYIGSGTDIDEADVIKRERTRVDEETRDWKKLAQQLPSEIWIENR